MSGAEVFARMVPLTVLIVLSCLAGWRFYALAGKSWLDDLGRATEDPGAMFLVLVEQQVERTRLLLRRHPDRRVERWRVLCLVLTGFVLVAVVATLLMP